MQREMAILEDRADPHGEGLAAGVALAEANSPLNASNPCSIDIAAMRAYRAIRPQPFLYKRDCCFFVMEARGGQDRLSHRRKLLMPPNVAVGGGIVKCNVALAIAKSENRPAIGSGARPPRPKGSAGRWRGSPRTSGPTSCTKPRRAPIASRSSRPVRRPTGSPVYRLRFL